MKILVNLFVPAISERYDVFLPDTVRIQTVIYMLGDALVELSNHRFVISKQECLCSIDKNILLRKNATLEQYGIKNGDHLILI